MTNIRVENVSFAYGRGADMIKKIDLELDHRSTALIGQNGAGKTTLVKLLKGLLKPGTGDIFVRGINTKESTVAQLSRHIGLVFQNPNDQLFKRTVLSEVMFGPINLGQAEQEAKQQALQALERVGLGDKLEVNPHDLGLSEKKLVSIASVVAMNTDIIILDEPTIAQDFAGKERIRQIIQSLKEEGKLVLTIIHDMDFVAENFERTVVLNQGTVLLDGATRDVFSHKDLLRQACLDIPYVTQLAEMLGAPRTMLTVQELIEWKGQSSERRVNEVK
ncbi:Energy-coupling factor transporter ATP-binding protein EcfA2 [Paenibacillus sp. CECT 9249]|uniref:energy-coupling factor ABC transporter ATP-binding protein n=1 Tax=Paenibacillus sp. CECT 9249 TaxID=2845385 RepID=UPI001E487ACC|nr:ATP-binding cassette domain-containing protein [Paenibacillus sp. CECT 9249]CAH0121847.1 Energy-coupling factor transporter ATP-binding protein EcfA2 [Paenibacillus sp. CECT 9249]